MVASYDRTLTPGKPQVSVSEQASCDNGQFEEEGYGVGVRVSCFVVRGYQESRVAAFGRSGLWMILEVRLTNAYNDSTHS